MKQHLNEEAAWLDEQVSSSFLFILGLMTAPALVLTRHLLVKTGQVLLYLCLARLRRQRLFLSGSLIFLTITVVFSLFNPMGRILIEVWGMHITEGALRTGLSRGLTVLSLLYLSRFSVRSDLRLPGALGMLVARSFYYLNRLLEAKKGIAFDTRDWAEKLDHLLENACRGCQDPDNSPRREQRTRWRGFICLGALLVLNWYFVFMTRWGIF